MKRTKPLEVLVDSSFSDSELKIHPNDGADLELMRTVHPFNVYYNTTIDDFRRRSGNSFSGSVVLENSCRHGTVVLPKTVWETIGEPKKVLLIAEGEDLGIFS